MKNASMTEAFKIYYDNVIAQEHNNPQFIARWGTDPARLETQVLCHKMGQKVGDSGKYTCDGEVYGPTRWPYDANGKKAEPNYSDPPIKYMIGKRMKGIGTTWWDWKHKRTVGLGFDFDSLIDHGEGVGIPQEDIDRLDQCDADWLQINKSTHGNGRHMYIWFQEGDQPVTENHTEHAAVARAFLPLIAKAIGFADLEQAVDCYGGNLWIHHVEATKENQGFALVKPATQILTAAHVPPNWRDHLEVVSGGRTRVRVLGWTDEGPTKGDELDEMTEAYAKIELDEAHLTVLEALDDTGHTSLWVGDHRLWQGHTGGLKYVFDDLADRETPLRGLFDTNSMDQDPGKPNCLTGDTRVITREGVKPIRDLAGKDVEIITSRGAWVTAPFKSYGEQEVFAVTLKRGKDIKVIKSTADHRWFMCKSKSKVRFDIRKEVNTCDLERGQVLVQLKPKIRVRPSITGIHHGLVWGDGTHGGKYKTSVLPLYGSKDAELLRFFIGHPRRKIKHSVGGTVITNLPYHFKSLPPLHYDKAYLYGWLAGYFAADGCAEENGRCRIVSANVASIEHVKQISHILGIETSSISKRVVKNSKYDFTAYEVNLKASDLKEDFFLLTAHRDRWSKWAKGVKRQHRHWRVVDVKPAGRDEVFCCTVPETHCFCLEDFILIGNCFMRPKPNGAWDVYRFGESTDEHPLWDQQGKWTHTTYNFPATLKQICLAAGGYEGTKEDQGFMFDTVDELKEALSLLKSKLVLPEKASGRALSLHNGAEGKTVLVISKERGDEKSHFPRYVKTPRGWEVWIRDAVETPDQEIKDEQLWNELDEKMRALKIAGEKGAQFDSWVLKDDDGSWTLHPRENIKAYLMAIGMSKPDPVLGSAIFKSWTLVNEPFQAEYPGGRMWNRAAAQFVYSPVELKEGEEPCHPTWTRLMEHCGCDLNEYVRELYWCKDWGITTGGDYLVAWVACMFQNPFGKLPYLFMYGPQNSGKSSFHECIDLLLTRGVEKADRALTSEQGYNGELQDAVLAVVDEVDISKSGSAVYNKLKEWVTGLTISIHAKYKQVQDITSTLHFVQMSNDRASLPVFPGDTRITAMNVPSLEEEIPRDQLHALCRKEAPHFMRTLMDFEIPTATGRLMLPVVETQGKLDASAANVNELDQFLTDACFEIPGAAIKLTDFKKKFLASLEEFQRPDWKEQTIRNQLSGRYVVGKSSSYNQTIVCNLSFNPQATPGAPYTKSGSKVVKEGEE